MHSRVCDTELMSDCLLTISTNFSSSQARLQRMIQYSYSPRHSLQERLHARKTMLPHRK